MRRLLSFTVHFSTHSILSERNFFFFSLSQLFKDDFFFVFWQPLGIEIVDFWTLSMPKHLWNAITPTLNKGMLVFTLCAYFVAYQRASFFSIVHFVFVTVGQ